MNSVNENIPNTPPFTHGFVDPHHVELFSSTQIEKFITIVDHLKNHWIKRPLGLDATTVKLESKLKEKAPDLICKIYEQTLGKSVSYGDAFLLPEDKCSNLLMQENLNEIYCSLLKKLSFYLKTEHIHYRQDCFLPFIRIISGQEMVDPAVRNIVKNFAPVPHYDDVWRSIKWPDGTCFNNTLSFTLALKMPKKGHGILVSNIAREPISGKLRYLNSNVSNVSIDEAVNPHKKPIFTYHRYRPGELMLHSGHEFHCIAPFNNLEVDDTRMTMQGWCVWVPSQGWQIFG